MNPIPITCPLCHQVADMPTHRFRQHDPEAPAVQAFDSGATFPNTKRAYWYHRRPSGEWCSSNGARLP